MFPTPSKTLGAKSIFCVLQNKSDEHFGPRKKWTTLLSYIVLKLTPSQSAFVVNSVDLWVGEIVL